MKNLLGKLVALPVRVLNIPAKVVETIVDPDMPEDERLLSVPLDVVADAIEDALDLEDE